ncbi:MAG: glycine betaine/L-proline ABC transporter ATP-binding protein [Candidatus Viridilinea halotolerans]|uniref:Glycine betaine/L-proline ABC transporter ATP-binding protein n=1 Tax=Candidatus Viridilinea halotolerans TaxID=2491704 RepID=A0A426TXT9_9CHLR|nr:MAG: glycine betaine/L-proline ABC transporter ATP-binding protein [Candidatus Viridilinea halotolerans]
MSVNRITPNMMPPKIVCRDVWKIFGRAPRRIFKALASESMQHESMEGHIIAVRGVSFEVRTGETFVVMGLSGSGKSTLIRCISRITEPTHGEILVDGQDVLRMRPLELRELRRKRVSMVFQHFGLFPHRRVIDNVAYGLEVRGVPRPKRRERATEVLALVGLEGWEYHFPRQLSGGMQQRVGLARALAVDPDILLFDEPFSALDPLIRHDMQGELQRLQATLQKTSIFITHDFTEALKLGDKIAVMRHGQIVQVGTPQELVINPINDYVGAFVRDAPRGRVLTAQAVMVSCPLTPTSTDRPTISAQTYLDDLLPLMAAYGDPVAVTDDDGLTIGHVDRAGVLKALIRE